VTSTRKRPAQVREAILAAATDLIRQRGVAGTSISDVIAASGTSAGAIYHHFASKEQLVLEVGRAAMAVPMAMILATSPDLSSAELLAAALDRVAQDEGIAEMLLQIWAGAKADPALYAALSGEISAVRTNITNVITTWCADHSVDVDPRGLTNLIVGLVSGFAVMQALGVDDDVSTYLDLAKDLVDTLSASNALEGGGGARAQAVPI
jgi:AcrR family transcriptional regulator